MNGGCWESQLRWIAACDKPSHPYHYTKARPHPACARTLPAANPPPCCSPADLQEWDAQHAAVFAASEWRLEVEGHSDSVPLLPHTFKSKRVAVPAAASGPAAGSPHDHSATTHTTTSNTHTTTHTTTHTITSNTTHTTTSNTNSSSSRRRGAQSRLQEFRADKLLPLLFPALKSAPLLDQHKVAHSKGALWRPVVPELRRARGMILVAKDGATGAESRLDLGRVVFARERIVPAGGEGRCMYDQKGVWQADNTCGVHEYLWALCIKVGTGFG